MGKSGVSVGYFDTEQQAARAYDRAAIGLLGKDNCLSNLNFPMQDYEEEDVPALMGKKRDEVKALLKSERVKVSHGKCEAVGLGCTWVAAIMLSHL